MKLSTRSRYGVRLMLDLAIHATEGPVHLGAVAKRQRIGVKYLEQIAMSLKKADYVKSVRGPKGGHLLSRPPREITIAELVGLLEGDTELTRCANNEQECDRWAGCVTRIIWAEAAQAFWDKLQAISLMDLVEKAGCVHPPEECDENGNQ